MTDKSVCCSGIFPKPDYSPCPERATCLRFLRRHHGVGVGDMAPRSYFGEFPGKRVFVSKSQNGFECLEYLSPDGLSWPIKPKVPLPEDMTQGSLF